MTVVMATNAMEVIDILADRIAIFVNGKVQFFGSKAYLNRHYGKCGNYQIIISTIKKFHKKCTLKYPVLSFFRITALY